LFPQITNGLIHFDVKKRKDSEGGYRFGRDLFVKKAGGVKSLDFSPSPEFV
jgi:hypothetical protein